jgi:hypothetical protein
VNGGFNAIQVLESATRQRRFEGNLYGVTNGVGGLLESVIFAHDTTVLSGRDAIFQVAAGSGEAEPIGAIYRGLARGCRMPMRLSVGLQESGIGSTL